MVARSVCRYFQFDETSQCDGSQLSKYANAKAHGRAVIDSVYRAASGVLISSQGAMRIKDGISRKDAKTPREKKEFFTFSKIFTRSLYLVSLRLCVNPLTLCPALNFLNERNHQPAIHPATHCRE